MEDAEACIDDDVVASLDDQSAREVLQVVRGEIGTAVHVMEASLQHKIEVWRITILNNY